MSTWVEIAEKARKKAQIPGGSITAISGNNAELQAIVDAACDVWNEIQNAKPNWRWQQRGFTFNTTASDDTYAYTDVTDTTDSATISRFRHWIADDELSPMKRYLTSSGVGSEGPLCYLPWEQFEYRYKMGNQNDGIPVNISVDPNDNLVLGPAPDADYTITGNYQMSAQVLALATDVPEMPAHFHDYITWLTVEEIAYGDSAQHILMLATRKIRSYERQLQREQQGRVRLGNPLA
jgi:hypothetical protein